MNSVSSRSIQRGAVALLLLIGAACNGKGPMAKPEGFEVSGKVLLPSGSPLTGGTLILRPVEGLHGATAQIQNDGSFELVDPTGKKSVVSGKYLVFLRFNNPDHTLLQGKVNTRYQNSEDGDSDLIVDTQGPRRDLMIRLNR